MIVVVRPKQTRMGIETMHTDKMLWVLYRYERPSEKPTEANKVKLLTF